MKKKTGSVVSTAKTTSKATNKGTAKATVTVETKKSSAKNKKIKVVPFDSLNSDQKTAVHYLAHELNGFKNEPNYSNVGFGDLMKTLNVTKKGVSTLVSGLVDAGYVLLRDESPNIVFVNWPAIPADLGKDAPDLSAFKNKPAATKSTTSVEKDGSIKTKTNKKAGKKSAAPQKFHPYAKFGVHGSNTDLDGFTAGDQIGFELKGRKVKGEYRHLHINKHSPNGYVVIMRDGKVFERSPKSVWAVKTAAKKVEETVAVEAATTEAAVQPKTKTTAKKANGKKLA